MTDHKQCAAKVSNGLWSPVPCSINAKYEENGEWYCKRHLPSNVKAKRAARTEKWKTSYAADQEKWRKERMLPRAVDLIREIEAGHNDPRGLCEAFIAEYDGDTTS